MRGLMRQHKHGANLNWEIVGHPPYNPDLAPIDFHLFSKLKTISLLFRRAETSSDNLVENVCGRRIHHSNRNTGPRLQ